MRFWLMMLGLLGLGVWQGLRVVEEDCLNAAWTPAPRPTVTVPSPPQAVGRVGPLESAAHLDNALVELTADEGFRVVVGSDGQYLLEFHDGCGCRGRIAPPAVARLKRLLPAFKRLRDGTVSCLADGQLMAHWGGTRQVSAYNNGHHCPEFDDLWQAVLAVVPPPTAQERQAVREFLERQGEVGEARYYRDQQTKRNVEFQRLQESTLAPLPSRPDYAQALHWLPAATDRVTVDLRPNPKFAYLPLTDSPSLRGSTVGARGSTGLNTGGRQGCLVLRFDGGAEAAAAAFFSGLIEHGTLWRHGHRLRFGWDLAAGNRELDSYYAVCPSPSLCLLAFDVDSLEEAWQNMTESHAGPPPVMHGYPIPSQVADGWSLLFKSFLFGDLTCTNTWIYTDEGVNVVSQTWHSPGSPAAPRVEAGPRVEPLHMLLLQGWSVFI